MKTNNMEFSGINENVNFRKHFELCIIFYVHRMQITKQELCRMSFSQECQPWMDAQNEMISFSVFAFNVFKMTSISYKTFTE